MDIPKNDNMFLDLLCFNKSKESQLKFNENKEDNEN